MALPGVHGVAVGEHQGQPCLLVLADRGSPEGLPDRIDGIYVRVKVTGPLRALEGGDE